MDHLVSHTSLPLWSYWRVTAWAQNITTRGKLQSSGIYQSTYLLYHKGKKGLLIWLNYLAHLFCRIADLADLFSPFIL